MNQTYFLEHMSEALKQVHKATQWKENGFVPNFKETDKVLMEVYKKGKINDRNQPKT